MAIRLWGMLIALTFASTVLAQSHVPIRGTQNIHLSASVEQAIQVDGVKDSMRCDAARDIYVPANRGYSSAWGSVVEIVADGKQFRSFSLDDVPHLDTGHIEDFEITDGGGLYILAREVRKYSDLKEPIEFGATYVLKFSPAGNMEHQTRLNTDFGDAKPSGLAVLKGEDFLITSYSPGAEKKIRLFANVFASDGSLKRKVPLNGDGTQAANGDTVGSMSVFRPMTVKSGGLIYVLRGSTREPVYVFSDSGELIRTVRLQATNMEFSSPKVVGNHLIVHQHLQRPPSTPETFFSLAKPALKVFPIFDLDSGALVQQFEWGQDGELACYDGTTLTFMQQGLEPPAGSYYAILLAQTVPPAEPRPLPSPTADIKFELRWIVSCSNEANALPLRDDEAASRYCLSEKAILNQDDIASASVSVDALKRPILKLNFTPDGSEKLRRATIAKDDAELGVLIGGELIFKVMVMGPEPLEHEAVITVSGLPEEELQNWVARLNAQARKRVLRKVT